jgi:Ca2+-binding RTX toxin-like protein
MSFSIGSFSVSEGTGSADYKTVTPGQAYFAYGGNDILWASGSSYVTAAGKQWWIPSIISGGEGNDSYYITYGSSTFIADASSSSGDSVQIYDYASNITSFFSIENRHLFVGTSWGTNLIAVDGLNSAGAIESIKFMDLSLSGSTDSINSLLASYKTRDDQSIDYLISNGDFYPNAWGVNGAEGVRSALASLYGQGVTTTTATIGGITYTEKNGTDKNNILYGTPNADILRGNSGDDELWGYDGDDYLVGNQGNDKIYGGYGSDQVWGGLGDDIITGNQGNDVIYGNDGNDTIWGGLGDDMLINNIGNDTVYGNSGADSFVLCYGTDIIKDFNAGEADKIIVYGSTGLTISQGTTGTQIARENHLTILEGVSLSDFNAASSIQYF